MTTTSIGDAIKDLDFNELKSQLEEWLKKKEEGATVNNGMILGGVAVVGTVSMLLGLFVVLVPLTYVFGGYFLYKKDGWRHIQAGVGGSRFVALNGIAWTLYAVGLLQQLVLFFVDDLMLSLNVFLLGLISYMFMIAALLTYQGPERNQSDGRSRRSSVDVPDETKMVSNYSTPFNEELQRSALMMNGDTPSGFWYLFVGLQLALSAVAFWIMLLGNLRTGFHTVKLLTIFFCIVTFASSTAITHAMGGKWRHIRTSYSSFQPGKGGRQYVTLQAVGWTSFALSMLLAILAMISSAQQAGGGKGLGIPGLMFTSGLLGLIAELLIVASLFKFEDDGADQQPVHVANDIIGPPFLQQLAKAQFNLLNKVFGPSDPYGNTRSPAQEWGAYKACEETWKECIAECHTTNDQYLVVGIGFVGKRLVNKLLERGERKVRVFDISPVNPWEGDDRVEFVRGDVTKASDISAACQGVQTLYATFAIIRFMDRLEHQAALSYHINVTGTEVLLQACKENSVCRLIVTSSSHATTDEDSQPRMNRTEEAPYVNRQTAHNHYGWTKALADQVALRADGAMLEDGGELEVVIVRPCSGVFGADDRFSFEKMISMGIAPGIGDTCVMDWVYVDNVVLGHLLAEAALQQGKAGVRGEAFNISNNDPVQWQDMWWLVKKIVESHPDKKVVHAMPVNYVYFPNAPLWVIAYVSEMTQKLFKGKVSLGRDLDMLTPAMLQTSMMSYTYPSLKAAQVLGYRPAFTLEEAIQQSIVDYYATHFGKKQD